LLFGAHLETADHCINVVGRFLFFHIWLIDMC